MKRKSKIIIGIIAGLVFYLAAMVDTKPYYTEKMVDCQVGKHVFTLKAQDCRGTTAHVIKRILK